jgi:hypothetical protein
MGIEPQHTQDFAVVFNIVLRVVVRFDGRALSVAFSRHRMLAEYLDLWCNYFY